MNAEKQSTMWGIEAKNEEQLPRKPKAVVPCAISEQISKSESHKEGSLSATLGNYPILIVNFYFLKQQRCKCFTIGNYKQSRN